MFPDKDRLPLSLTYHDTPPSTDLPFYAPHNIRKKVERSWKWWWYAILIVSACFLVSRHVQLNVQLLPYGNKVVESSSSIKPRQDERLIIATEGAVAADNGRCSDIGVNILRAGGNAVDAAIAAVFCLGVVNMFSSGIGGGGFMTIRKPPSDTNQQAEVITINFRETAPASANKTMFRDNPSLAKIGGLAVAVPGEVLGMETAYNLLGSGNVDWSDLINPSIKLAKGWKVDKELAKRMAWPQFQNLFLKNPDWKSIFAPNGKILKENETIRRVNLSKTLTKIATGGANAFYTGEISKSLVDKINSAGGNFTTRDMANYAVEVANALQGKYRGRTVYTTHAPSSGSVMIHMLNILDLYDDMKNRTGVNVHRAVEVMKYGAAARTRLGDLNFLNETQKQHIYEIVTKEFAEEAKKGIKDDRTFPPDHYKPDYDTKHDHGTTHVSVVQKDGMAVSVTSTVNLIFGSQVLDPVTGIILNDQMDDFSIPGVPNGFGLRPSPANYPHPGKRPASSTAPLIIDDPKSGNLTVIGASGGSHIPSAILQALMNLDWDLNVSEAIEYGRVHDQLFPQYVEIEDRYPTELVVELCHRRHNITIIHTDNPPAVVQAAVKTNHLIYAASDSRKNGRAAGYYPPEAGH